MLSAPASRWRSPQAREAYRVIGRTGVKPQKPVEHSDAFQACKKFVDFYSNPPGFSEADYQAMIRGRGSAPWDGDCLKTPQGEIDAR